MAKGKLPVQKQKPIPVKIVSDRATMPTADKGYEERERKYRAEDAVRTLQRADEIRRDKALMKDVQSHVKEQMKTLSKIK